MSPNQNISIWMAPLPTEIPGTQQHISTPKPGTSYHQSHPLPPLTFHLQANQRDNLIEEKFEKEWKTVREVFPEFSDNPRELATIALTNLSTTPQAPPPRPITALPLLPSPQSPTSNPKPSVTPI